RGGGSLTASARGEREHGYCQERSRSDVRVGAHHEATLTQGRGVRAQSGAAGVMPLATTAIQRFFVNHFEARSTSCAGGVSGGATSKKPSTRPSNACASTLLPPIGPSTTMRS